jgi:hypothetical protein
MLERTRIWLIHVPCFAKLYLKELRLPEETVVIILEIVQLKGPGSQNVASISTKKIIRKIKKKTTRIDIKTEPEN